MTPTQPADLTPAAPARMTPDEAERVRRAAAEALRRYPGPIGELVSRELLTWHEIGWRLGHGQIIMRAVQELLATAPPVEPGTPVPASVSAQRRAAQSIPVRRHV